MIRGMHALFVWTATADSILNKLHRDFAHVSVGQDTGSQGSVVAIYPRLLIHAAIADRWLYACKTPSTRAETP